MCESYLPFPTISPCQLSLFCRFGQIKAIYVFTWGWCKAQGSLPCSHLVPGGFWPLGSQELYQQLWREQLPALVYRLSPKVSSALALRAGIQTSSGPKMLLKYSQNRPTCSTVLAMLDFGVVGQGCKLSHSMCRMKRMHGISMPWGDARQILLDLRPQTSPALMELKERASVKSVKRDTLGWILISMSRG